MKSIEERAEEYASQYCDSDCALCDDICGRLRSGRSFIAGAESEREELLRWRDPEKELPEKSCRLFVLGTFSDGIAAETGGWYTAPDKKFYADINASFTIIGWRPIIEL